VQLTGIEPQGGIAHDPARNGTLRRGQHPTVPLRQPVGDPCRVVALRTSQPITTDAIIEPVVAIPVDSGRTGSGKDVR